MADHTAIKSAFGSPLSLPSASQQDWEVLSLSMSASAFGTSGSAPLDADCTVTPGDGKSKGRVVLEGNSETVDESKDALLASESDLPLVNLKHLTEGGGRMVSDSEAGFCSEGWKTRYGNVSSSDVIMNSLPAEFVPETTLLLASQNPFDQVDKEGEVEGGGLPRIVYTTESGSGIVEGPGDVKNKSDVREQKVTEKGLCSFCKDNLSATWEKWQSSLLQFRTRESNTLWSIALVATVMGLVVVGYRWQRERSQNQQLRIQLSAKDEKVNGLLHQIDRLREIMTGRRRVPVVARIGSGHGLIGAF